jgi:hypothetical protein
VRKVRNQEGSKTAKAGRLVSKKKRIAVPQTGAAATAASGYATQLHGHDCGSHGNADTSGVSLQCAVLLLRRCLCWRSSHGHDSESRVYNSGPGRPNPPLPPPPSHPATHYSPLPTPHHARRTFHSLTPAGSPCACSPPHTSSLHSLFIPRGELRIAPHYFTTTLHSPWRITPHHFIITLHSSPCGLPAPHGSPDRVSTGMKRST